MTSKSKFKMPTDKQIWLEVEERLATYPEALKILKRVPDRQILFDEKKAWYKNTPNREREAEEHRVKLAKDAAESAKAKADADAAYLALRKVQGKPIVTVKQFLSEFPDQAIESGLKSASQRSLHEAYEMCVFTTEALTLQKKITRVRALSRKLLYTHLSKAYGLYRRINKSDTVDIAFEDFRARLWNSYKIKTHHDIPRASILLKLIFEGASEKTIHLYSRTFQLAIGYDVEEADFQEFIVKIGGMEKIRKAYATAIAANDGKWLTPLEKDAEYSATMNSIRSVDPFKVVQLTGAEGSQLSNDLFGYYCLVVAHIDPMNQLELFGQWPADQSVANAIIKSVTAVQKQSGEASWLSHKAKSSAHGAKQLATKLVEKLKKQDAKDKRATAAAKKQEEAEKRFAKKRAAKTEEKSAVKKK